MLTVSDEFATLSNIPCICIICIIVLAPFCWKCVWVKSYTYHCALTGVQVLVTHTPEHAHWLANFCWGLLIGTAWKVKATEISYLNARSLVTFLRGFILWQLGTCFNVWLWQKRKDIITLGNLINTLVNQITSCSMLFLLHSNGCWIVIMLLMIQGCFYVNLTIIDMDNVSFACAFLWSPVQKIFY
jgi:hypothetical protein